MNSGIETAQVIGATSESAVPSRTSWPRAVLRYGSPRATRARGKDLTARAGVAVTVRQCDVLDDKGGASFLTDLEPLPDTAVCVVGLLGDQKECEHDSVTAESAMRANYIGPALLTGALAERFERRGSNVLVGARSVASERGRASNYVYGSAKTGFTAFLSGLRGQMAASGAHVVTAKPGFVQTLMIEGMEMPGSLTAMPEEVVEALSARFGTVARRSMFAASGARSCPSYAVSPAAFSNACAVCGVEDHPVRVARRSPARHVSKEPPTPFQRRNAMPPCSVSTARAVVANIGRPSHAARDPANAKRVLSIPDSKRSAHRPPHVSYVVNQYRTYTHYGLRSPW